MKITTYEKHPKGSPRSAFVRALKKSFVAVFSPGPVFSWGIGLPFLRPWWTHPSQQQEATSERPPLHVDGQRVLLPSVEPGAHRLSQQEQQALIRSLFYIPDLTERWGTICVGYLMGGYPYTKGATSKAFFDHLVELVGCPFGRAMGSHSCDLGRCGRGPGLSRLGQEFRYHGRTLICGNSEIFVPGDNVIYRAPSMILHYIRCHGYAPPPRFVEAVVNCPDPRSREYCTAITTIAPKMITPFGEPLAADESFTVEFAEGLSSEEVEFIADMCIGHTTLVERKSERVFRVLCSTSSQLWGVLALWRQHDWAAVCRTTTTPGDIETLYNKLHSRRRVSLGT